MTGFENWLGRRKIVLLTLVGIIVCLVLFDDLEDRLGRPILDVQNGYTIESVREDMLGYGPEGRAHYALMAVTLDFVFPTFYGGFLCAIIILSLPVSNHMNRGARAPCGQMSGVAVCCCCRFCQWRLIWLKISRFSFMLRQFPDITAGQVALADITTRSKFMVLNVTLIAIFLLVVVEVIRGLRRP